MATDFDTQTYVNDSETSSSTNTVRAQDRSPDVLVKRNLAQQSRWLNDETGDRSWATHETQQVARMMNVQVEALARGN